MEFINKYKVVIAIILPVLILVLIRQFGSRHFKSDAPKLAEQSRMLANIITEERTGSFPGDKLFVRIGDTTTPTGNIQGQEVLNITPGSVLNKDILSVIRKHDGPVFLVSDDISLSSRLWMVLSQMGCSNIYIISGDPGNEVLKYKFRPDATVSPELKQP